MYIFESFWFCIKTQTSYFYMKQKNLRKLSHTNTLSEIKVCKKSKKARGVNLFWTELVCDGDANKIQILLIEYPAPMLVTFTIQHQSASNLIQLYPQKIKIYAQK